VAAWVVYVILALAVPGGLGLGDATLGGLVSLALGYIAFGPYILLGALLALFVRFQVA